MQHEAVISPLTQKANVKHIKTLSIDKVVECYQSDFGIDVSNYFKHVEALNIYQCNDTELMFYYPFCLAGDGNFYAQLSKKYQNYYSKWKWEHTIVAKFIKDTDKILEIGCGNGYFLQKFKHTNTQNVGLELNDDAVKFGKTIDVKIINQSIEKHSTHNAQTYDVVCAFQLFEHINDAGKFIEQTINCLKKGGLFAIGVPNNDSYYFKEAPYHTLNLPPHHMLLWTPKSLKSLAKLFNLDVVEIHAEQATSVHKSISYTQYVQNRFGKSLLIKTLICATRPLIKRLPRWLIPFKDGATVVAIFRKK